MKRWRACMGWDGIGGARACIGWNRIGEGHPWGGIE